ncbi:MAG: type I DNA topoisomerase [Phycisphaeraceae bacterium]|nr:type I DNA topoisomerase [Phycisphaeraceae bacterium]
MAKKKAASTTKKRSTKQSGSSGRAASKAPNAQGKHLVIVESPTKARTINKYLGSGYVVMASVGHVRDLPSRNPKGEKRPVPGVDLQSDFEPVYEILPDKKKTITELKKAVKQADDVWFATDLDREGEAIAWHLAQALNVELGSAKRVVFNAITRNEIENAFAHPRPIDQARVDAQQARRILDRIVGYQVSPLLWKKVAGGLSAGRVQSVATRLVVEREREIEAFDPEEFWRIGVVLTTQTDAEEVRKLAGAWNRFKTQSSTGKDGANGKGPTVRDIVAWLKDHQSLRAELVKVADKDFRPTSSQEALKVAQSLGFRLVDEVRTEDPRGKGAARHRIELKGEMVASPPRYVVKSLETRPTTSRPSAPFITSTLQQAASTQLGFPLSRTMRVAQQLYEGINIKGEGQIGLITYMRTDSTHLTAEAIDMARGFVKRECGPEYLPEKPNFFSSSNKKAQEAHEAIRPTDVAYTPSNIRSSLTDEQFRLYDLIWRRFVACQMLPARWDSTTAMIEVPDARALFRATGRQLRFDGFYRIAGMPRGEEAILPALDEGGELAPLDLDPSQNFTAPPPRYTEASLQKKLEEEGIGRPSTYAAIIETIQTRKYVEQIDPPRDRRLMATDLGKVVTDKLIEAFPRIMDVAYTREMESSLDEIETEHTDWRRMLHAFYGPFRESLDHAMEAMTHAKAETEPAPFKCPECGAATVYRFGRNGRFLSCSTYPDCKYASPIDREGKPQGTQITDIQCPLCRSETAKRSGRFGPFLSCVNYPECKGIVKLDPKKGFVVLPKAPPHLSDLPCPKCQAPLNLRDSKRGLWLSCSKYPSCRGRQPFKELDQATQKRLETAWEEHLSQNPVPVIHKADGQPIGEGEQYMPRVLDDATETASARS